MSRPPIDPVVEAANQAEAEMRDPGPRRQTRANGTPLKDVPIPTTLGLDDDALTDATIVAAEGQQIARDGIPFLLDGIIPAYGMLGFLVAFAKAGKSTWVQQLAAAVAMGIAFLGRVTKQTRVLIIAAEDPAEYTAYLARHLQVPAGCLTFYRRSVILDRKGLARIVATVKAGGYGLVLIASWQAVVRGLMREENDNAAGVRIVEEVKIAARDTGVPWLIDAHSGKGEDQSDDADPSRAMRGATGPAGAADYTLWLRYSTEGPFATKRRLSGKGRFVSLAPMTIEFDPATSTYTNLGDNSAAMTETTWNLIQTMGALTTIPQSADVIARAIGFVGANGRVTGHGRRQVQKTLRGREGIVCISGVCRGQATTLYRWAESATAPSQGEGA